MADVVEIAAPTVTETNKKLTHLGFEIVNKCRCGKEMRDDDRQELVFNGNENMWYRACITCINNRCQHFPDEDNVLPFSEAS